MDPRVREDDSGEEWYCGHPSSGYRHLLPQGEKGDGIASSEANFLLPSREKVRQGMRGFEAAAKPLNQSSGLI
jgi:hypothetical protein